MTTHIIETVGSWGVKTRPFQIRAARPGPGDPVDVGALEGYPFKGNKWAYISHIDGQKVSFCIGSCSMFLQETGHVSISGGPFAGCNLADLEPTHQLKRVRFWNWGDNCAGAAQGVDYFIDRPIFALQTD
jgi:hypothetical protein